MAAQKAAGTPTASPHRAATQAQPVPAQLHATPLFYRMTPPIAVPRPGVRQRSGDGCLKEDRRGIGSTHAL